jgi:preprotein translocase subunit SecG
MNWLYTATVIAHVLLAASIVGFVLLQRGRGADAGAGFGSGASGTVFGARGSASFLSRTTAGLAAGFIATSLTLAYLGSQRPSAPSSVTDRVTLPSEQTKPAVPLPAPVTLPAPVNSPGQAPTQTQTPQPAAETPPAATTNQAPQTPSPQAPRR